MKHKPDRSRPPSLSQFGVICGLALFAGETITSIVADNQTFIHIFFFTALFSTLLGLLLSTLAWLFVKATGAFFLHASRTDENKRMILALSSVLMVVVQGGIITNYLYLYGTRALSLPSFGIDALWISLCTALFALNYVLLRKNPVLPGTKLSSGLFLSVMGMALLSIYYDRPYEIDYGFVTLQVISMFAVCAFCFSLLFVTTNLLYGYYARHGGIKNAAPKILLLYGFCFSLILFISGSSDPAGQEGGAVPVHPLREGAPNVFLFVMDTLRADHLSCYGYEFETSPRIDRFSREALRFDNCYSTANWTVPGHASIFTGRYSISHGAHKVLENNSGVHSIEAEVRNPFFCFPLNADELTLAEILRERGYRTAAVVSNHGCVSRVFGLDQGFDHFFARPPFTYKPVIYTIIGKLSLFHDIIGPYFSRFRIAENINEKVLEWIDSNRDEPFFMFVNYMDTHDPYFPPPEYQDRFPGRIENHHADIHLYGTNHKTISQRQIDHLRSQYDGEIAYLDNELGKLFDRLRSKGLYENSIIVLTSDHGEYLGEHQLYGHSVGLYEPVIRVPLIIKPQGSLIWQTDTGQPVQIIDIVPTVLRLLDLDIPDGVQGTPLQQETRHLVVSEHYVGPSYKNTFEGRFFQNLVSVVEGGYKYILASRKGSELFDLTADPTEIHNLESEDTARSDSLRSRIDRWRKTVDVKELDGASLPGLDDDTLRDLKALGYIR